jgi:hypothetical protein
MPYRNMDVIMLIRYKTCFRLPTTSLWLVLRSCRGELLGAADFLGAGDVGAHSSQDALQRRIFLPLGSA